MGIVFMGTPDFSVSALEKLHSAGEDIVLAVTQPDRQRGRGRDVSFPPVKECALKLGIEVFQPEKLKDKEAIDRIAALSPEFIIVSAFGQILPKEILDMPERGCINIHASLLPEYRGAAPIQRCILDGKKKSGVTIMKMDEGLDTGDILLQRETDIGEDETGGSLFDKLSVLGAELIVEALPLIRQGKVKGIPQEKERSSYAAMLKKEEGRIDFKGSAEVTERKIRAFSPWPGTFTDLKGKTLKIWRAEAVSLSSPGEPGTVEEVTKEDFTVRCAEGGLKVKELQLEGKKKMSARDFLLGVKIKAGDRLR